MSKTPNSMSLPLYERVTHKNSLFRALDFIILFLLLSLLSYRLLSLNNHGLTWLLAFLCEVWFTFNWLLIINIKWNKVDYRTYPQRLLHHWETELPAVDMFVTTADPILEPPIITVNTVLSLMAVDYPANKLACYVSDDGGSALTFYALMEASKFAKLWVPFCKRYGVLVRAPFRYFLGSEPIWSATSLQFKQEWTMMKDEYEKLIEKIENAVKKPMLYDSLDEFDVFSNVDPRNHPTIIKVMWENRDGLSGGYGLPHLVYVSREKHPKHPHHYKAGAMNVLVRVSGLMTNAPFMLNVDCDMYANNPQIVLHAMCFLLGSADEKESAFVQSPQIFYDGVSEPLQVLNEFMGRGIAGIQGPFYGGTGCFHRRRVIYGACPDEKETRERNLTTTRIEHLAVQELQKTFGESIEFAESTGKNLSKLERNSNRGNHLTTTIGAMYKVASCCYEYGTSWGVKVGWLYGSTTEDVLTGLMIHARGWRSMYCTPNPPAFLGSAPSSGPSAIIQQKRWAMGLLEILLSRNNPLTATLTAKLQFRQCLGYIWILIWGLRSIPELCYAVLPAYCIITNTHFLPKGVAFLIPIALFGTYNMYTLWEFHLTGISIHGWWNSQMTARIISATAWLSGVISITPKLLGLSEIIFEVTQKTNPCSNSRVDATTNAGRLTFDQSPVFVVATGVVLVYMAAVVIALLGLQRPTQSGEGVGLEEIACSVWVVLCFWPFGEGLFRKGKYGIPISTICKSTVLAFFFVHFCVWSTRMK
ncbi:cellulose synthase-like protein B4 isoform X2 [Malania oleifera]|uniref:cellulose synthase-like protein B4 isoform X2 n=1 Tax=Malania oleifera TaxID=397392 RepID=UPI0025AE9C8C|nr:cellulose synthase-like protein B4 isoform X2 [Malania oleifera]